MECKLVKAVDLPSNALFICEIVGAYTEEQYLTDGQPDIRKINSSTLTMPDNNYWTVGDHVGKAWGIGRNFAPEEYANNRSDHSPWELGKVLKS